MICGVCGEDWATGLAVLGDQHIVVHDECFDNQASLYAQFPDIIMPISRPVLQRNVPIPQVDPALRISAVVWDRKD